jgi:hypothetical protein
MKQYLGWCVGVLCFLATAGASEPPATVSPERLQKLIEQLGDARFKVRQEATQELARLGRPALRALKEAAASATELEVRKRAEALIEQIRTRDRPRHEMLSIVSRMQQAKPVPSDRQVAVAIYLLSVSRAATNAEIAAAEKRLLGARNKSDEVEELMWPLLTGHEFNDKLAELNLQVLDARQKATGGNLAEKMHRLNSEEFQKIIADLTRRMTAAMNKRSDEQVVEVVFLVFLGRVPQGADAKSAVDHIKKQANREKALDNIIWAVMNTKEFYFGK